jgi:hypothetical protein
MPPLGDLNGETEVLQTLDQTRDVLTSGTVVEVACAQILVEGAILSMG